MALEIFTLILLLIGGHFLCDYPLQGQFMSEAKNSKVSPRTVPSNLILLGHSTIHGMFVTIATGWISLGYAEIISHYILDKLKINGLISFKTDQNLHIAFKFLYVTIIVSTNNYT